MLLPTHTMELFDAAVVKAAELLRAGEVVAVPTETVYGLAANACDERAVARIFEIKGRPPENPLIVHVAGLTMAQECAAEWPPAAEKLAAAFWPGPLTLVVCKAAGIPALVTAGGPTVGIRWPSHPFVQALIRACGFPLAAPSANLSNQISPTNAGHVRKGLGDKIPLIIDGGQSQIGIESTVLDVTIDPPRLLRPGMVREESLLAVTGKLAIGGSAGGAVLRSPGMLRRHYAPKAKMALLRWRDEEELKARIAGRGELAEMHVIAHTRIPMSDAFGRIAVIPHDPEAFARAIYAELHHCDELGAKWIVVEAVPETEAWRAIADRLERASAV